MRERKAVTLERSATKSIAGVTLVAPPPTILLRTEVPLPLAEEGRSSDGS